MTMSAGNFNMDVENLPLRVFVYPTRKYSAHLDQNFHRRLFTLLPGDAYYEPICSFHHVITIVIGY